MIYQCSEKYKLLGLDVPFSRPLSTGERVEYPAGLYLLTLDEVGDTQGVGVLDSWNRLTMGWLGGQ